MSNQKANQKNSRPASLDTLGKEVMEHLILTHSHHIARIGAMK